MARPRCLGACVLRQRTSKTAVTMPETMFRGINTRKREQGTMGTRRPSLWLSAALAVLLVWPSGASVRHHAAPMSYNSDLGAKSVERGETVCENRTLTAAAQRPA